ncbi:predicted protein [Aspergillus terreus NIH2624]|uniref:Developmental regulatory protein wetA n=1 Tax=Aspergillus terreus (strain NIH 2624 / FGSC A1156) TaxID=341663 RepID=Q0CSX9_ASPTN|nr:uncharacterized protein ATEG_03205 [Aspergillus terreus NIH2624]EAU36479.1 predicted protein [Aspergillus terreus NIH2624]
MFAQPFDHSFNDLFNQYVNMESANPDGSNKDVSFPNDLDQIFSLDSLSSDCGDHSPTISTSKVPHQSPPQSWGKDLWCMPQEAAVSSADQDTPLAFQDSVHPPAVSDLSANLEASSAAPNCPTENRSPSTPPATPSRKAKSALVTPKSIRRHREPNDRRALLRKQSFSPNLTRSSQLQKHRMAYPEAWAQRFQHFNYRHSDDRLPLSPPPSDILVQHENFGADGSATHMNPTGDSAEMPHQFDSSIFTPSPAISMPSPSAHALAQQQPKYLSHSSNSALTSSPPSADDIFSSPHSSDPQSMSSWHSDSFGTPAIPFTPDLHSQDAQAWWSPMTSRVAQRQPSYQQMAPQKPMQNTNSQHDMLQGGLMIQLDPSQFGMSNSSFHSSMSSAPNPQETQAYSHTAATTQNYVDSAAFAAHAPTTSRSPSLSPRAGGSPKNGAIMKTPQRRTNGRKLSAHSMSAPKPVRGPSVSPKGSNKSVTVSFVNFTPNDSQKILTGVAPSGSSKTKARREQEARDRRRKLSEAALNAVRKAGGDVEALEAVLC